MKFLRIQKLCYNAFGYTFKPDELGIFRFYALLNWALLLGVSFPEAHFAIENRTNVELVTDTLATWLTCMSVLTKVGRMFFKRNKLYDIVLELEDMWLKASDDDKPILKKASAIDNRLAFVYLIFAFGAGCSYLINPIAKAIYELNVYGNATWILPMRSMFIYDTTVSPNYELTFLWFAHGTFLSIAACVGVDCMFYGCAFNMASHFQVIQKRMRKIQFETVNLAYSNAKSSTGYQQLISYHQKMLLMCEEFSELYKPILFIQFLITALQICVVAYQLTLPNQFAVAIAKVFFLGTVCFQCFTYCDAGSQLASESFKVSDAIYDSPWYESSSITRKDIGFILMRAQKPFVFNVGFYVANLNLFMSFLSASGSYITILQSLHE